MYDLAPTISTIFKSVTIGKFNGRGKTEIRIIAFTAAINGFQTKLIVRVGGKAAAGV